MVTLLLSVVNRSGGVRLTAKPLSGHLSRNGTGLNTTVVKNVEKWLNEPKNRLTILNQLSQLEPFGTGIGMSIGDGVSFHPIDYKYYASRVIKKRRAQKTR